MKIDDNFQSELSRAEHFEMEVCEYLFAHYNIVAHKKSILTDAKNNRFLDYDLVDNDGYKYEVKAFDKLKIKPYNEFTVELSSNGRDRLGWYEHCKRAGVDFLIICLIDHNRIIDNLYIYDYSKFYESVTATLKYYVGNDYQDRIQSGNLQIQNYDKVKIIKDNKEGKWLLMFRNFYDSDWSVQQSYFAKCLTNPSDRRCAA
jgi:hypothetical protein